MALKFSTTLRNSCADAITTAVAGTLHATSAAASGTFTGTSGEPVTPTEPAAGRPRPRRFATNPTAPIVLPTIVGDINATTDASCVMYGDVDPYHLLADDEELLLLA